MEIGLAILLFVCMTALLYVVLSLKISRQVDLQIKEFYKTRIHADMQEFYREMEGYAALFENRIQRFRVLVERNEAAVRTADQNEENMHAQLLEQERLAAEALQSEIAEAARRGRDKKNKTKIITKGKATKVVPVAKGKTVAAKPAPVKKAALPVAPQPPVSRIRVEAQSVSHRPAAVPETSPVERQSYSEADDSAIAEELMKDLFLKDEIDLSRTTPVKKTEIKITPAAASAPEERPESPGMASFFSRLGKAIEPVLFGEKSGSAASSATAAKAELTRTAPAAVANPAVPDFGEVLRRAEQIKAEKKAERERAEIEARAEFYAAGDSLTAVSSAPPRDKNAEIDLRIKNAIAAENEAARMRQAPEIYSAPAALAAEAPRRNALVVKELDRHTVSFLIDSLVKDNGYRKQALRALTENNIPLDEIARLSKIDIGELELMRQLGRF